MVIDGFRALNGSAKSILARHIMLIQRHHRCPAPWQAMWAYRAPRGNVQDRRKIMSSL